MINNDRSILAVWVINIVLFIIGLGFRIFLYNNIFDEASGIFMFFLFPYFIQPIGILVFFLANCFYITPKGKRIFNPLIIFCFFIYQVVPAVLFYLSLLYLVMNPVYEIIRYIISVLFIIFTVINYRSYRKSKNSAIQ